MTIVTSNCVLTLLQITAIVCLSNKLFVARLANRE